MALARRPAMRYKAARHLIFSLCAVASRLKH